MRKFMLLFLMFAALGLNAQQISGFAKDSEGKPVAGATASLLKDTGKLVLKLAVSKENGLYSFSDIKPGKYRVSLSHVSFQPTVSAPFAFEGSDFNVPEFKLVKATGNLKGVVVTATKPIVEVKADKTILNVEGTVNAVGSDALELLRKSPGMLVDKDDNLSLSGKNGVQVYVDGRAVPLTGTDLAMYLRSIQSTNIESIELITNPSAKYEAAGNAGIINIRLKKNKSLGVNGSVNAGWNIGTYAKYNAGFALNYRNAKMNIFGTYNFYDGTNLQHLGLNRTVGDTAFDGNSRITNHNISHNYKVGIDYFINKQSTVGVMANGTLADPNFKNYSSTPISYVPTGKVDRILVADNHSTLVRDNVNLNGNYQYNGKGGRNLTLNADHGTYTLRNDQYQPNYYYDPTGQILLNSVIYHMIAPTDININSFKADWEQDFQKGKLSLGGKTGNVKSDNDFQRYNVTSNGDELDKDRSNRFVYTENINALYANFNRQYKGFMLQAGLRMENTIAEGTSTGQKNSSSGYTKYDSSFKRNYTDFFPSAAFTFNKNPKSQISVTYSRRIDRPAYQDLNPFEFKLDEYTFQKGNINLRPQYTNSFGITHTYKFKLNTTVNYSHVKDMFVMLPDTAEGSKAFISKRNLASQDMVSLTVNYPFFYKSYSVFGNLNTNYSKYQADYGPGRKVDLEAFAFSFFAQNTLKFAKTWTAEVSGFYNAPTVWQGAFKSKSLWSIDMGMQKQVMKGKATMKAAVSDVFHTLRFRGTSDFAGQVAHVNANWESRQFKLSLVYRFGSNQVKAARQHATSIEDENKRTQGGTGLGIGQ
ncbi:MAG: TonB-dependent receptor domain-containing protein [Flavisolibacter sp.]